MQHLWDPESTASYWINAASRSLLRTFDARLRPLGFSMSYLPVLGALLRGEALSQKELARIARVEQPTMAETLARMERDGVVMRQPNPDDGRGVLVSLSPKARTRLAKAKATLTAAEQAAMAGLSEEERALLRGLLQRVANNLDEATGAPGERTSGGAR
jgi:DNA-binding MarR family transcriptional regulator